jgi:hypothetical protein
LKDFFAMATVMVRHCLSLMSTGDEWSVAWYQVIYNDIYILYLIYSLHARESENLVHELIHHWLSCNIYMNYSLIFTPVKSMHFCFRYALVGATRTVSCLVVFHPFFRNFRLQTNRIWRDLDLGVDQIARLSISGPRGR